MDEHHLKYYNVSQNSINLEFENFNEFEIWSHEIQVSTQSYFLKNFGSSDMGNKIYSYYKCNRNGFYISKS